MSINSKFFFNNLLDEKTKAAVSDPENRVIMVLGGADTGKTTLVEQLISLLAKRAKVGVVDLDVGQSHIGPPTTLAWGLWEGEFAGWEAIEPLDIYFTGSTSPSGNLLPCLAGAKAITDQAKKAALKVIIDTTGLIDEGGGRALKEHKVEMIGPNLILALQKRDELEHILCSFKGMKGLKVMRIPVSREARQKTTPGRVNYREEKFRRYFEGGETIEVSWKEVGFRNTFIGRKEEPSGVSLLELEKYLGCEVVSVGKQGETLFVVYRGRYDKNGIEPIKSLCRVSGLILRDVDYFLNHLVGLVDGSGRHRALGIVEDIDYSDDKMSVFSPIDPRVPIGCVIFGKHKITRDGYQIE